MPILALNPFIYEWRIKVRVTRKYELRSWTNQSGTGEIFTVEMIDSRGDLIQGSFFNRLAIAFFPKVVQGRVYLVSNGQISMSNKKFTAIKNDYYIRFNESTEFEEASEDPKISFLGY